jgi:hypothetical protein
LDAGVVDFQTISCELNQRIVRLADLIIRYGAMPVALPVGTDGVRES